MNADDSLLETLYALDASDDLPREARMALVEHRLTCVDCRQETPELSSLVGDTSVRSNILLMRSKDRREMVHRFAIRMRNEGMTLRKRSRGFGLNQALTAASAAFLAILLAQSTGKVHRLSGTAPANRIFETTPGIDRARTDVSPIAPAAAATHRDPVLARDAKAIAPSGRGRRGSSASSGAHAVPLSESASSLPSARGFRHFNAPDLLHLRAEDTDLGTRRIVFHFDRQAPALAGWELASLGTTRYPRVFQASFTQGWIGDLATPKENRVTHR